LSIGDTATFGDVSGAGPATTVSLNGATPTLAALTFSAVSTSYTVAAGSGGSITLQGAQTPVDVTGTHTISASLIGAGLNKTGAGTLVISGADTYTGTTTISNGAIQVTGADNRLPVATALVLGDGTSNTSGKLILGDATAARGQSVGGIATAGTGLAQRPAKQGRFILVFQIRLHHFHRHRRRERHRAQGQHQHGRQSAPNLQRHKDM